MWYNVIIIYAYTVHSGRKSYHFVGEQHYDSNPPAYNIKHIYLLSIVAPVVTKKVYTVCVADISK